MTVTGLTLSNFRNFSSQNITFSEGINIIKGQNAQGKTNLIEAVYYLASGRSFRASSDRELISFESDNAYIKADILSGKRQQTLEVRFIQGRRKQFFANGVKENSAGSFINKFSAVVFCPDDLSLIKGGAAERRKLMDASLSQLRPAYTAALSGFNKLHNHKTRILRDHFNKPSLLDLLDDFNMQLAQKSAQLIYYRSQFAQSIARRAHEIHKEFSGGQEELSIKYKTTGDLNPAGLKPDQLLPALLEHQKKHRDAEIRSGLCLSGAHKDDLEIEINEKAARRYASQGQSRTACVSIKLAECDILNEDKGEPPVLLLDDVLSELDDKRQKFILEKIGNGQVFITCCDETAAKRYHSDKALIINNGNIHVQPMKGN